MNYATVVDLENRMGATVMAHLAEDNGTVNPDAAADALQAAQSEIDAHLAGRYEVPVVTPVDSAAGRILQAATLDIAEYRLHLRKPPVFPEILRKADRALALARAVVEGHTTLPGIPQRTADRLLARAVGAPRELTTAELQDL